MNKETQQVKFLTFSYRILLQNKLKVIEQIENEYNKQNKELFDNLINNNLVDKDTNIPIGIIQEPKTPEEIENNNNIILKIQEFLKSQDFKRYTVINLEEYINLLCINPNEILQCIEP